MKQAFARWQQSRPHKRSRVPQNLLKQAAAVCNGERPTRVARQLGISYAILKKQLELQENSKTDTSVESAKQEFIKVDLKQDIPAVLRIVIERKQQEVVRFTLTNVCGNQIKEIIKLFL